MTRPTYITLHLHALQHNVLRIRQMAPQSQIMAMVKANAYGHGLVPMAQTLAAYVSAFGVLGLQEAILLRKAGITQPIVLIEGIFHADELAFAMQQNLILVVHQQEQVAMLRKAQIKHTVTVWLKVNTGMNRLGFLPQQASQAYQALHEMEIIKKPIGWMTHFAAAEILDSEMTAKQIAVFKRVSTHFPGPYTLANSAAIIARPDSHGHWVRPGLILYGVSPFPGRTGQMENLQPVMSLHTALISVYPICAGDRVGYGGAWVAQKAGWIGIAAIGYGDGYPQRAPSHTPVLVDGVACTLAGRVSMDMLAIDLSNCSTAAIGSIVTLWGKDLPVERIAQCCQMSVYELLTQITSRPSVKYCVLDKAEMNQS